MRYAKINIEAVPLNDVCLKCGEWFRFDSVDHVEVGNYTLHKKCSNKIIK